MCLLHVHDLSHGSGVCLLHVAVVGVVFLYPVSCNLDLDGGWLYCGPGWWFVYPPNCQALSLAPGSERGGSRMIKEAFSTAGLAEMGLTPFPDRRTMGKKTLSQMGTAFLATLRFHHILCRSQQASLSIWGEGGTLRVVRANHTRLPCNPSLTRACA